MSKNLLFFLLYININSMIDVENPNFINVDDSLYNDIDYAKKYIGDLELSEHILTQIIKNFILNKYIKLNGEELEIFRELISRVKSIKIELLECTFIFKKKFKSINKDYKIIFTSENEKQLFIELLTKYDIPYDYKDLHNSYKEYLKESFLSVASYVFFVNTFLPNLIMNYITNNKINEDIYLNNDKLDEVQKFIITFLQNDKNTYHELKNKIQFNESELRFLEEYIEENTKLQNDESLDFSLTKREKKNLFNKMAKNFDKNVFTQYINDYRENIINLDSYGDFLSNNSKNTLKESILKQKCNLAKFSSIHAGPGGTGKTSFAHKYIESNVCAKLIEYIDNLDENKKLPEIIKIEYTGTDYGSKIYHGTGSESFCKQKEIWLGCLGAGMDLYVIVDEADNIMFNHTDQNSKYDNEAARDFLKFLESTEITSKYLDKFHIFFTTNITTEKIGVSSPIGRRNFVIPFVPIPNKNHIKNLILNIFSNIHHNEKDYNKKKIYFTIKTCMQFDNNFLNKIVDNIYTEHQKIYCQQKWKLINNRTIVPTPNEYKEFLKLYNNQNWSSINYNEKDIIDMEKYFFGALNINSIYQSIERFNLKHIVDPLLRGDERHQTLTNLNANRNKKKPINTDIINDNQKLYDFIKNKKDYLLEELLEGLSTC